MKTAKEVLQWARRIRHWSGMLRTEPTEAHWQQAEELAVGQRLIAILEQDAKAEHLYHRKYAEYVLLQARRVSGENGKEAQEIPSEKQPE